jgi:hypothetical protein
MRLSPQGSTSGICVGAFAFPSFFFVLLSTWVASLFLYQDMCVHILFAQIEGLYLECEIFLKNITFFL